MLGNSASSEEFQAVSSWQSSRAEYGEVAEARAPRLSTAAENAATRDFAEFEKI